jgi:hypothetical protein
LSKQSRCSAQWLGAGFFCVAEIFPLIAIHALAVRLLRLQPEPELLAHHGGQECAHRAVKFELRAITNSPRMRDRAVMISSTMPSAKYSCSGSPLMLLKGKTAIDGLSGSASTGFAAVPFSRTLVNVVKGAAGAARSRRSALQGSMVSHLSPRRYWYLTPKEVETRAQQWAMPVIGFLDVINSPGRLAAFHQGLGESGYVLGQNVAIEIRSAEGHHAVLLTPQKNGRGPCATPATFVRQACC